MRAVKNTQRHQSPRSAVRAHRASTSTSVLLHLASWTLLTLSAAGCAPPAANLSPRDVAPDAAPIFGHVQILNHGTPVTSRCQIVFTDQDEQPKSERLALDRDGWVFTTVRPGPTYLSSVLCDIPDTTYYSGNYKTRRLAFQATGGGRIVYFGHVRIDVQAQHEDKGVMFLSAGAAGLAHMGAPSAAAAAISVPASDKPTPTSAPMANADLFGADVKNDLPAAVAEYQRRYGPDAQALRPEASIAGAAGESVGQLADGAPPALAAGFPLGQPIAAAESRCTGAGMAWQKGDGGVFSCNGAPADLGVPVLVRLTACGETICEVTADAGADGAPWATLAERFGKLTRTLAQQHGDKHQRETRALEGCNAGPTGCADASRVRKSETWRWPDKRRVTLVLDGGPPGSAPTLRIVYSTADARPAH